jgi:SAM-dependent methyltransferase
MSDDDPTAIFERMYEAAAAGGPQPPWERGAPHPLLEPWGRDLDGAGRRALVVGSGLGNDAEFVAARGFDVVAFDVSPTAVAMARERNPGSPVDYRVADLFDLPAPWRHAFDLVVECLTVQSLPHALHARATAAVAANVAPGGTLFVAATAGDGDPGADGPPWPLARAEVEAFATLGGLEVVAIEDVRDPGAPPRWHAEFRRPAQA